MIAARVAGWAAALAVAAAAQAQEASPSYQACLLRELARAAAETPVGTLRETCLRETVGDTTLRPDAAGRLGRALTLPEHELSLFEKRFASEFRAVLEPFALLPHRPNYLLPVSHVRGPTTPESGKRELEATFQVSFKFPLTPPLAGGRLLVFFGYTGRSWWQLYETDRSRPFREYNHEPDLFVAMPGTTIELAGWRHRMTTLGLNHQSNGRSLPESRSWNRIVGEAFFDRGSSNWASLRLWRRIPERAKSDPLDNGGDDNPGIGRWVGHGELRLGHATPHGLHGTLTMRRSLHRHGKGALMFDLSMPTVYSPSLRLTAHVFDGYGESLIDQAVRLRRVGIGVMLNDWF